MPAADDTARVRGFRKCEDLLARLEANPALLRRCIHLQYFFQPRTCMLQWRHSGLVNYLNRTPEGLQVRLEGLWIG